MPSRMRPFQSTAAALFILALGAQTALAQGVSVEFNAAEQVENACRISVRVASDAGGAAGGYEAAIFDKEGLVRLVARLDLGEVPQGGTRLRQFALPDLACTDLGQIALTARLDCAECAWPEVTSRLWQDRPLESGISIDLNALEEQGEGCRLTFVTRNGSQESLGTIGAQLVFFDQSGALASLNVFELGEVGAQNLRVRRYALADHPCTGLGSVLLNEAGAGDMPKFTTQTTLDVL